MREIHFIYLMYEILNIASFFFFFHWAKLYAFHLFMNVVCCNYLDLFRVCQSLEIEWAHPSLIGNFHIPQFSEPTRERMCVQPLASVQKHLRLGFGNITRNIEMGVMSLSFSYELQLEYGTMS